MTDRRARETFIRFCVIDKKPKLQEESFGTGYLGHVLIVIFR